MFDGRFCVEAKRKLGKSHKQHQNRIHFMVKYKIHRANQTSLSQIHSVYANYISFNVGFLHFSFGNIVGANKMLGANEENKWNRIHFMSHLHQTNAY